MDWWLALMMMLAVLLLGYWPSPGRSDDAETQAEIQQVRSHRRLVDIGALVILVIVVFAVGLDSLLEAESAPVEGVILLLTSFALGGFLVRKLRRR